MASGWWRAVWYELAYYTMSLFYTLGFSLRFKGRRHMPRRGGVLVIANHQSFLDPPMVGVAVRRRLNYLARKTLFRNRFFGWLIGSVGAIPIDQEASGTAGIKAALGLLKAGNAVLIFPEGSRTATGQMQPLKPGVVVLIRRANVPVLPVGVAGAYQAWPAHQRFPTFSPPFLPPGASTTAVVVGKPIPPCQLADLPPEKMLHEMHKILLDLSAEAERIRRKP